MKRRVAVVLGACVVWVWMIPACGGDSESEGSGGSGGSDAGAETSLGGSAGSGGSGATGGSGGSGATGGSGGSGGSAGCVASQCPSFQSIAQGCCRPDDTCGYDGSALGLGCVTIDEVLAALEGGAGDAGDPSCPTATVAGFTIQGCCLPTGFCGFFDPILTKSCVDPAQLPPQYQPDTGPPTPCGSGVDASTDAPVATDAGSD